MRFLTGDDTGIIKWVRMEAQKVERFPGPRRRGDPVERFCWLGPVDARESRVAIAHASGIVEARQVSNGEVLGTYHASPSVRCLLRYCGGLLVVAKDGKAAILKDWCAEAFPAPLDEPVEEVGIESGGGADADGTDTAGITEGGEAVGAEEGAKATPRWAADVFELPAPVADAKLEPIEGSHRLAFGGDGNNLKIYDLAKHDIVWKARNLRENFLCLRVPNRVATIQWATPVAASRSLILVGTTDGKIRLYDANLQRKALFEMKIGHKRDLGTSGWTGVADDIPRPVSCSTVAMSANGKWSMFVANTMGVMREYELRNLPTCKPAKWAPGKKRHLDEAADALPFKRGYRGIMGSIRALDVHHSGACFAAVGLGRFAYVFETRAKKMVSKIFLKQKLCSVLMSEEAYTHARKSNDSEEDGDITGDEEDFKKVKPQDQEDSDGELAVEDDVQEGFSSENAEGDEASVGEDDACSVTGDEAPDGKAPKKRRKASSKGRRSKGSTSAREGGAGVSSGGTKRVRKGKAAPARKRAKKAA